VGVEDGGAVAARGGGAEGGPEVAARASLTEGEGGEVLALGDAGLHLGGAVGVDQGGGGVVHEDDHGGGPARLGQSFDDLGSRGQAGVGGSASLRGDGQTEDARLGEGVHGPFGK
jgi:hypothetical protein